ncbi:MAG TPA: cyclic pyranopterin monophosphate synthase MoaC [Holophagaceae bacterium]|jgi:cyclic pyranopterin phosphate synthase|nr:cyclic pyranopterin monophosphate synthase MoaC [Holophagaceae bacterium]
MPNDLTHLDPEGLPRMVDVGAKPVTARRAVAVGVLQMDEVAAAALSSSLTPHASSLKKGDPWPVVRIAAIQGVKRASDLIPLAHPLIVDGVEVAHTFDPVTRQAWLRVEVRCESKTGVEMEALAGVSAGLLALYDMLKAVSQAMDVGPVRLLLKEGGRRGLVTRPWTGCPWEG